MLNYIYLYDKYLLPNQVVDLNHPDTYKVCHIVLQFCPWIMYNLSELGIHGTHLLNMDEQYLGSCGTKYQVHEAQWWWSNNREADLSDPNLPPDLFLTFTFPQSSSLDSNLVMQLSYAFFSLSHINTYSSCCRSFWACRFPSCWLITIIQFSFCAYQQLFTPVPNAIHFS